MFGLRAAQEGKCALLLQINLPETISSLMFNTTGGGVWNYWLLKVSNLKLIYNPFLFKNKQ